MRQYCVVLFGLALVNAIGDSPRLPRSGGAALSHLQGKCSTIPDLCTYMSSFSQSFRDMSNQIKIQSDDIKKLQGMISDLQSSFGDLAELTRRSVTSLSSQANIESTPDPECAQKPPMRLSVNRNGFCLNGRKFHILGTVGPFATFPSFGNNAYRQSQETIQKWIKDIKQNGGNTISLLIGFNPSEIAKILSQSTSKIQVYHQSILQDINTMLQDAAKEKVTVQLILFSSSVQGMEFFLEKDPVVLRFTDLILSPIVQKLKGNPTISSWVIFNHPEDFLDLDEKSIKICTDPESMKRYSPMIYKTKTRTGLSVLQLQKVTNWIADSIHNADENALVTIQVLSLATITDSPRKFMTTNYFSNACLKAAGNRQNGYLDFYQSREASNPDKSRWFSISPFLNKYEEYNFDKPVVIVTDPEVIVSGSRLDGLWVTLAQQGYSGTLGGSYRMANHKEKVNNAMQALKKAVLERKLKVNVEN
ncbi:mannan endo-1,4-beta-mannosidase-like [Artemia franciscana]|uniref:Uncharacterized protein n=1 Tax=Artemia franciscana TaxID=6661 RepID=A0AA88HTS3_ARTSF|nr:hypothetical protein QYM36_010253 [Artemia franciscana]